MSGEGGGILGAINLRLREEPLRLRSPALAVAKPREGKVALFVSGAGEQVGMCELTLDEATHLHGTLGNALALMKRPGRLPDTRRGLRLIARAAAGLVVAAGLFIVFILPALLGER